LGFAANQSGFGFLSSFFVGVLTGLHATKTKSIKIVYLTNRIVS
jgi:hypothetical protein